MKGPAALQKVLGLDEPIRTITSSGKHAALVYSFLVKYFGTAIGANLLDPAPTITTSVVMRFDPALDIEDTLRLRIKN